MLYIVQKYIQIKMYALMVTYGWRRMTVGSGDKGDLTRRSSVL